MSKNISNERMKSVRILNGNLTQKEAAAKIGYTTQYYSRVERGMIDGCIDFWRRFVEFFKIPDCYVWEIINNKEATTANVPHCRPVKFDETIAKREQIPT